MLSMKQDKVKVKAAWITFQSMEQRDEISYDMKVGYFRRMFYNLCNCGCFKPYLAKWAPAF